MNWLYRKENIKIIVIIRIKTIKEKIDEVWSQITLSSWFKERHAFS